MFLRRIIQLLVCLALTISLVYAQAGVQFRLPKNNRNTRKNRQFRAMKPAYYPAQPAYFINRQYQGLPYDPTGHGAPEFSFFSTK